MRLSLDLSKEQHRHLKAISALHGKTMRGFILGKVFSENNTAKMDETEHIVANPKLLAELEKALANNSENRIKFESLLDLKNALGI